MTKTIEETLAFFRAEAEKRGKSIAQFIDTDIRQVLLKAWEIQQRTKKPVSLNQLVEELNRVAGEKP